MNSAEAAPALIELAWSSVAALTVAPLQDVFDLGTGARMNVPGRANGNWRWRFTDKMVSTTAFEWLRDLTEELEARREREIKRSASQSARRHIYANELFISVPTAARRVLRAMRRKGSSKHEWVIRAENTDSEKCE